MVNEEIILKTFEAILVKHNLSHINTKCKAPIDEEAFSKLRSHEEVAEFFGLEFLPNGRPDIENTGVNESISFYDKRNHVLLDFRTDDSMRIEGIDFTNNHVDDGEYGVNLKDIIRDYYETPYALKKATWLITFERGVKGKIFIAGDCHMYGIHIYDSGLWGGASETLNHEMSHAFAFSFIDWKNGEKLKVDTLPKSIKDRWEKATQEDYAFQEKNNLMHQDTTDYASKNPNEDFAEMGALISTRITNADYQMTNANIVHVKDENSPKGYIADHLQTNDEILKSNPNRAKLMRELISTGKYVDMENKREYANHLRREMSEKWGEEYHESW